MDIQMPDMDGVTATREIRQRLGIACPPVVAMTAYSMQEDAGRFMRQGLDDYVGKPVKSHHLSEVLHRWLRVRTKPPGADDIEDAVIEEGDSTDGASEGMGTADAPAIEQAPAAPAPDVAPGVAAASERPAPPPPLPDEQLAADLPALDAAVLRQLLEIGGAEFTRDLYAEFEQEAGQLLQEAHGMVQVQQFNELLLALHQLKGTAATMGAAALTAQTRRLEHQLKNHYTQDVVVEFELLQQYFTQFVAEYPHVVEPVTT